MKLILDTANINKINEYLTYLPVDGVTTNPSIIKKENEKDIVNHLKKIQDLIGNERTLHVQVVSDNYEGMLSDAEKIINEIGGNVFIKVPVNKDGLKVIKQLKKDNVKVTATAIYSEIQALLAMELGADFLAPYINRMQNLNTDPYELVRNVANHIERNNYDTKILGASYKNIDQVLKTLNAGASHVTVGVDVLDVLVSNANIEKATEDFASDWYDVYGVKIF